jgi:uncharacterized protein (TIGR00252 family)
MTYARQALGIDGEDTAGRTLEARGYRILARRYRTRFGEIDLVARQGDCIVFVEVKTRRGGSFGDPAAAVTARAPAGAVRRGGDRRRRRHLHAGRGLRRRLPAGLVRAH